MPELPEIEHLRRTLAPDLVGGRVLRVRLRRRDVVRVAGSRKPMGRIERPALLEGARVQSLERRGKSMAIVAESDGSAAQGRVLVAHMGMTGRLLILPAAMPVPGAERRHQHCEWELKARDGRLLRLVFRDPRRFGGLWPLASVAHLHEQAWSRLGPDALAITASALRSALTRTRAPIKAALLNQALLAGVGNIYADESLFAARIRPNRRPGSLSPTEWSRLAAMIRRVLRNAVAAGGSTVRDYVDAAGNSGLFTVQHRVYGRGGQPCRRCSTRLRHSTLAQRSTVFCPVCQQ